MIGISAVVGVCAVSLGMVLGFLAYLVAANLGLSVVFLAVPQLYLALKLAGAAYLGWLAFRTLRPGGTSLFEPQVLAPDRPGRLFAMGLLTNLLNPKIAVMYLSLIPQFVEPTAGNVVWQGFQLGALQICVSLVVNVTIVLAAGAIATLLSRRPLWLRVQRYLVGTVLGVLAVKLATDRTKPLPA